jgi:hypothetical protein
MHQRIHAKDGDDAGQVHRDRSFAQRAAAEIDDEVGEVKSAEVLGAF